MTPSKLKSENVSSNFKDLQKYQPSALKLFHFKSEMASEPLKWSSCQLNSISFPLLVGHSAVGHCVAAQHPQLHLLPVLSPDYNAIDQKWNSFPQSHNRAKVRICPKTAEVTQPKLSLKRKVLQRFVTRKQKDSFENLCTPGKLWEIVMSLWHSDFPNFIFQRRASSAHSTEKDWINYKARQPSELVSLPGVWLVAPSPSLG